MNYIQTLLLTASTLLLVACGENTTQSIIPDVKSIAINEENISIYSADKALELSASVTYEDNSTLDATNFVIWTSGDTDILEQDHNQLTGGIANGGDTNISINYTSYTDTKPVHVYKLTSYDVIYPDVNATGSYQFRAVGSYENNETNRTIAANIVWLVDNEATVEIDDDGIATITLNAGDTNVTTVLFDDTNSSTPLAPKTKIFTIN